MNHWGSFWKSASLFLLYLIFLKCLFLTVQLLNIKFNWPVYVGLWISPERCGGFYRRSSFFPKGSQVRLSSILDTCFTREFWKRDNEGDSSHMTHCSVLFHGSVFHSSITLFSDSHWSLENHEVAAEDGCVWWFPVSGEMEMGLTRFVETNTCYQYNTSRKWILKLWAWGFEISKLFIVSSWRQIFWMSAQNVDRILK